MKKFIPWILSVVLMTIILTLTVSVDLPVGKPGQGATFYIGSVLTPWPAYATVDYQCDGVDDHVQIQQALDALPVNGGKIVIYAGNYHLGATVSRAIDNIVIEGVGSGTYLANNGIANIFSMGARTRWVFRDIRVDNGGIDIGAGTEWSFENVWVGAGYVAKRAAFTTTQNQDMANKLYVDGAISAIPPSTGNVTGGGLANRIVKWVNSTSIGDASNTDAQISATVLASHTQGTDTALGIVGTKNPPIDADKVIYRDSTTGDFLVTSTWTQVKSFLKTYFDGIYSTIAGVGNVTATGMTSGYIPVATSTTGLTNSVTTANATGIYVTGLTDTSTLKVGTATPIFPLYSGSAFMSQLQVDGTAILKSGNWSAAQLNFNNTATIPEHIGTGTYDYTGNTTAERLLYATAPIFDSTDGTRPSMILILSGAHVGAVVEIEHYISTTEVQLTGENGFDSDLVGVMFGIIPPPIFGVANSGAFVHTLSGVNTGMFRSSSTTSPYPFYFYTSNAGNDVSTVQVDVANNGYSNNEAIDIGFTTGNMSANSHASIVKVSVDKSGATSSTNTTELDFINISQVGRNSSLSNAIHVGQGFDTALKVAGGTRIDPSYGYTVTAAHAVTDRVTGVAPGGTAFLATSAGNVQMFLAQNDYILLGSTSVFESVPIYLTTGSSHSILPTFYYSTGAGTWATLVVSDTTGGFVTNGLLSFNAPIAWAQTNATTPAGTAITNGYYIKVVRTRGVITTPPTESYFKLYTSSSLTDFMVRGNGTIKPVQMTDSSAPNDSIYYSTTAAKLVYKDSAGVVRSLY